MGRTMLTLGAGLTIALGISLSAARAESCDSLWFTRGALFKAAGYCFKTDRAIRVFGNAGCRYADVDDLPLSNDQKTLLSGVRREETSERCR